MLEQDGVTQQVTEEKLEEFKNNPEFLVEKTGENTYKVLRRLYD
jgi:hypothetical protein